MIESELRANTFSVSDSARLVRRICALAYFTVLIVFVAVDGIPTGRAITAVIIVAGLGVTCIGQGLHRFGRVLLDWLPFTAVLIVYDVSRSAAHAVNMPVHEVDIARAEDWLFGGTNPTVWLQQHFYQPGAVRWYDALATLIYMSHFIATPALAAFLWVRNRGLWLAYVGRVIALSFAGLVTYVLFPEAPPWFAARDHDLPPVARLSARGFDWLHLGNVHKLLTDAQDDGSNPIAAMPSLHTAFAMLVALFLASRIASRWRYLLFLYPAAMGLVLVYTGEHYVLDVVVGIGYAVVVHLVARRWERSRGMAREAIELEVAALP